MNHSQLPQHIFGIHDAGAEHLFTDAGKRGWVVFSVVAGDAPGDFSAHSGHGVIVRLNNGYGSAGTIPSPSQYDAFANACAQYVAGSRGAQIWIIGNETNLEGERPGNENGRGGDPITPERYGECFAKCYAAIKRVRPDDWVIPSPPGPWNPTTTYSTNPAGDWVIYFRDLLNECVKRGARPDALALHTYSAHDVPMDAGLIESEEKMNPPHQERHWQFRAYRDFLGVVPPALRPLPVFITESQHLPWEDRNSGWIQKAFAEINAWNGVATNQPIQALCLFRWEGSSNDSEAGWSISNRRGLIDDFRAALQNEYLARWAQATAPVVTKPVPPPTPARGVLRLAQARGFAEEAVRKLDAQDGNAAREILVQTIIPWFYATAPKHSTTLADAQAHTNARWHCEEATRQIEAHALGNAADMLRHHVLAWLASPGPQALGILSVEQPPKAKPPKKKVAAKKARTKKTKLGVLSVGAPKKAKRASGKKKTGTTRKGK